MTEAPAPLRIRRYRAEDHDAVWALHNLALTAVEAHPGNSAWDDDLHQIEQRYLAAGGEFLVGTLDTAQGERLVAMGALMRLDDHTAKLRRMRVHPDVWRRGYGRAMLMALEQRAVEMGLHRLTLNCTAHQIAAQALYLHHGWRPLRQEERGQLTMLYFFKDLA